MVSRLDAVVVRDVCRPKGRDQAVKGKNRGAKAQEYSKGSKSDEAFVYVIENPHEKLLEKTRLDEYKIEEAEKYIPPSKRFPGRVAFIYDYSFFL